MELLEKILSRENLNKAYLTVYRNKGTAGVDGITVDELRDYLKAHREEILGKIRARKYNPQPVLRVEIPKESGKKRKLGIPTVVDRVIQQAMQTAKAKVSGIWVLRKFKRKIQSKASFEVDSEV